MLKLSSIESPLIFRTTIVFSLWEKIRDEGDESDCSLLLSSVQKGYCLPKPSPRPSPGGRGR